MGRKYVVYLVFGVLAVLLLLTFGYESGSNFPACRYWGGMMGGMMRPMSWSYNPSFWIFLALLAVFAYYLLKEPQREDALSILEKRYISGKIKREEYLQILKDLKKE